MTLTRRCVSLAVLVGMGLATLHFTPAAAIYCAPWDTVCQQLKDQQQQADHNQAKLDRIQNRIRDSEQRMRELAALIRSLDADIAREQATINATQAQVNALDAQVKALQRDLLRRQAHINDREQLLSQRVRSMDKHGGTDYLALLLTSTSFNQLVDRVVTMEQIISADHQLVEELRFAREQVRQLKEVVTAKLRQESTLLASEQATRAQMQTDRADQQAALTYQKQLETQLDAQRKELEREQAAIKAKIQQLQDQYAAEARAIGGGKGQFIWPEGGEPAITQGFGCTDLLGEPWWPSCATRHFHTGIDIAGPYGAPVVAADSGVASVFWGWGGGYGNFVIIIHGNGYASVYGHLSNIALHDGQVVYRDQLIGNEGSTGYSTGPHLHFEIRYYGNYQNPCTYLGC